MIIDSAFIWQMVLGLQTVANIWVLRTKRSWAPLWCFSTEIHWTVYVITTGQIGFVFGMQIPLLISWICMWLKWRKE